jgi:hypothetical protein
MPAPVHNLNTRINCSDKFQDIQIFFSIDPVTADPQLSVIITLKNTQSLHNIHVELCPLVMFYISLIHLSLIQLFFRPKVFVFLVVLRHCLEKEINFAGDPLNSMLREVRVGFVVI